MNTLPRCHSFYFIPALLLLVLLLTPACFGSGEDEQVPEDVAETPAIAEVDALAGYHSAPVAPVLLVDIEDSSAARALFDDGVAHFESSDTFQQVSWMMDAEDASELQYRIPNGQGDWTPWRDVEITWNEGQMYNVLIRLDEPVTELEMRGGESMLSAQLEFYEEVVARDEFIVASHSIDDPQRPASDDEFRTIQSPVAPASLATPRSSWGAINPGKVCGNVVSPYRMAIHHTASPSNDGGDPAARMRGMQSYHMNSVGWCDIGYHFVVAQSGEIFQGRSHSDRPGTHVGGQNSGNVGISFIANFNSQTPTETQLNSGADIVQWVHDTHGVALNRSSVRGHREHAGQNTSCPGNNMVPMIDELLSRAQSGGSSEPPPGPPPGSCGGVEDPDASDSLFKDMPEDHPFYDYSVMLYDAGITQGCDDSPLMFCPGCHLTRQALAVMIARAADLDLSNSPSQPTFDDVPTSHTFYDEIEAIAAAGISLGCGNDEFCPTDDVTRAQVATMIYRALNWPEEVSSTAPTFDDVPSSSTHFEAIETLHERCVTSGCGDGSNFCPDNNVPRGAAAAFIARAFNLENNNPCAEPLPGGCRPTQDTDAAGAFFADYPPSSAFYDEAVTLYEEGITDGCNDSPLMFCPHCSLRRGPLVTLIARAANLDVSNPPSEPTFEDVPTDHPFYNYIEAAYAEGITSGCGTPGKFCPTRVATRGEIAVLLYRALDWPDETPDDAPTFGDVPTDHAFSEAIETMHQRCVTNGCGTDGVDFCPNNTLRRSHAAVFITRAFNLQDDNPCAESAPEPDSPVVDDSESESESEPDTDTAPESEPQSETDPNNDPGSDPDGDPNDPDADPDSDPDPDTDPGPSTDPEPTPDPDSDGTANDGINGGDFDTSEDESEATGDEQSSVSAESSTCSTFAQSPLESPLTALLLAAIGLFAIRRSGPET